MNRIERSAFAARPEDSRPLLQGIGACHKRPTELNRVLSVTANTVKDIIIQYRPHHAGGQQNDSSNSTNDVYDRVKTIMSDLNHFEKMLARSHSSYLTRLGIRYVIKGTECGGFCAE
jgi:magnesium transporter